MRKAACFLLLGLVLSGCIGDVDDGSDLDLTGDTAIAEEATVLEWSGYIHAGGAKEMPLHVQELQPLFQGVWSTAFELDVQDAPQSLEVELDWAATAASIQLMVKEPKGEDPYVIYETAFAQEGPLCIRAPQEALQDGVWTVMAHSEFAVDAELLFTARIDGSDAQIPEEPPSWPVSEFPGLILDSSKPETPECD